MSKYDDIINMPHYVSRTRPQMALEERAKQFSPFAALKGYEEAIEKKQQAKEKRAILSEYSKMLIDNKLKSLKKGDEAVLTYFDRDENVTRKLAGKIIRLEAENLRLQLGDETISFEDILDITS
ncbi:MAG: hypothetical protein IJ836_01500 [Spirochaetales bacterium]|nr:hypothetical protein [Spirochaetales bacterium]